MSRSTPSRGGPTCRHPRSTRERATEVGDGRTGVDRRGPRGDPAVERPLLAGVGHVRCGALAGRVRRAGRVLCQRLARQDPGTAPAGGDEPVLRLRVRRWRGTRARTRRPGSLQAGGRAVARRCGGCRLLQRRPLRGRLHQNQGRGGVSSPERSFRTRSWQRASRAGTSTRFSDWPRQTAAPTRMSTKTRAHGPPAEVGSRRAHARRERRHGQGVSEGRRSLRRRLHPNAERLALPVANFRRRS